MDNTILGAMQHSSLEQLTVFILNRTYDNVMKRQRVVSVPNWTHCIE